MLIGAAEHAHRVPMDVVVPVLEWVIVGINSVAVLVLVWGVIGGLLAFLKMEFARADQLVWRNAGVALRQGVGFYLLLALELLIAADIIETMIKPSLDQLAILGGITLIRIVTSYALGKELMHETEMRKACEEQGRG